MIAPFQTSISHSVRQALNISFEEYVVADVINFICSYRKNETKTASGGYREFISTSMKISPRSVDRAILELIKKGLVRNVTRQSVEITELWQEALAIKNNSRQNGASLDEESQEENKTTHAILAQESRHFGASYNLLYIHKKHKIYPKLPFLINFRLSFLEDFSFLGFTKVIGFSKATKQPKKITKSAADAGNKEVASKKFQKSRGAGRLEDKDRGFEEFWRVYPRKEGKTDAVKAWGRLYAKKSQIMGALASYAASLEEKNTGKQYIKLPASFLRCYTDYLPEESAPTQKTLLGASSADGSAAARMSTYEDDKAFEKSLALLKLVAGAIAAGKVSAQNANANAFGFVDTATGARIFDDRQAVWIEDLGGLAKVSVRYKEFDFDDKALSVWLNISALAS